MGAVKKLKNAFSIMTGRKASATVLPFHFQPKKMAAGNCHARAKGSAAQYTYIYKYDYVCKYVIFSVLKSALIMQTKYITG